MDVQVDRFGKVEAEDSHDGFCVDYVSSGYQIEIKIEFGNVVDERFYFVDRIKRNLYCFMFVILPVIWLTLFITLI